MTLKHIFFHWLFAFFILWMVASCSLIGLNPHHKTPKQAGKYPVFTEKDSLHGSLNANRSSYDVYHYNLDIDVDIDKRYLKGSVKMYFTALQSVKEIQIDLYANMKIDRIEQNGITLTYTRKYNAVLVNLKETTVAGQRYAITVWYEGNPVKAKRPPWEGGFVWKKNEGKPWVGVACEQNGASLWWPVKDHLSDEPDSVAMNVTVPAGLVAVSNGNLRNKIDLDRKVRYEWVTAYPINTYNVTLYIGNFVKIQLPYEKKDTTYQLEFYVLPQHEAKAKEHFKQCVDIIRFYEETFGDYPWWPEAYRLIESPYEGMEHQTAIAYGHKYRNSLFLYGGYDYIILHETAHEWWGNSVTAPDYAEVWLHEGFATYCEALFLEHVKGSGGYQSLLVFYAELIRNKKPVIGPKQVNYWNYRDTDIYMKGALFLHTLRNSINNDTTFFNILKTFYQKSKYTVVTTDSFIKVVNEATSTDYTSLFTQYLRKRTCPQLRWNYVINGDTPELHYQWANIEDDFTMPLRVKQGNQFYIIYPSRERKVLTLPCNDVININHGNSYIARVHDKDL